MKPFERLTERAALVLVTNKHVIQKNHCFVRINRIDGQKPDTFEIDPVEWYPHWGQHDVALALGVGNQAIHPLSKLIHYDQLLTREMATEYDIGIGDDILMIGRFIGHDGRIRNRPSVRFGNISIGVGMIYNTEAGYEEESYAVEVRSKPGYSGSSVIVYALNYSRPRGQI